MRSRFSEIRLGFEQLKIIGLETGDRFFETYGPGNLIEGMDRPYERFHDYELLLVIIQGIDPDKYLHIHKGTPFYFLAWLAFAIRDYEKAVFYMDSALSEDKRKSPTEQFSSWIQNPAGKFFCLNPKDHTARIITQQLKDILESQFTRFNTISNLPTLLNVDSWVGNFVHPMIKAEKFPFVTSIYSYLLEFKDRHQMLNLKPLLDGSTEPYTVHLFKGGLIFESLMKHYYESRAKKLSECLKNEDFKRDFSLKLVDTSANSLREILDKIIDNTAATSFNTTSKLRNTTGHKLVWDKVFNLPENYQKLFEQELNAIFFVIGKQIEKGLAI